MSVAALALIVLVTSPTSQPTPAVDAQGCFTMSWLNVRDETCTARVCRDHIDATVRAPAV